MASIEIDLKLPGCFLTGPFKHYYDPMPPIPSGSRSLDSLLGGGWPVHEICYLQGEAGTGKSSLVEEMAVNYLFAGGNLACFLSLPGEHPLLGFSDRVPESQVYLIEDNNISRSIQILDTILETNDIDVLAIVDDISSLCPDDDPVKQITQALNKIRRFIKDRLTIILVNQVRSDLSGNLYGATAYNRLFRQSSIALHLSDVSDVEDSTRVVGLTVTATALSPEEIQGNQATLKVMFGRGLVQE